MEKNLCPLLRPTFLENSGKWKNCCPLLTHLQYFPGKVDGGQQKDLCPLFRPTFVLSWKIDGGKWKKYVSLTETYFPGK